MVRNTDGAKKHDAKARGTKRDSGLTCMRNPLFRFTRCMNFHISVDFGSACCHNFRGSASISVAMTACSCAIDGGNVKEGSVGLGGRGKSYGGCSMHEYAKHYISQQKRELRIYRSSSRVARGGFGPASPTKIDVF